MKGRTMTTSSEEPRNTADLRGPGDPDEARDSQEPGAAAPQTGQHPDQPNATNIREQQQAHAAGTVPASYVGSGQTSGQTRGQATGSGTDGGDSAGDGGQGQEHKPEEALKETGTWDDDV